MDQKSKEVKVIFKSPCLNLHLLQAVLPEDEVGGDTVLAGNRMVSRVEPTVVWNMGLTGS